jgi:rod shape-determining protein MreC
MWRFIKAYRRTLAAALVVLVPATMISMGRSSCGMIDGTVRGGQSVAHGGVGWVGGWWEWAWRSEAQLTNEQLRAKVNRLREEKSRLIGVLQENARLRRLLDFKQRRDELSLVAAEVIGRDVSPFFRVMAIEIRVSGEVEPQMPVVVNGGVVGQIESVSDGMAQVLLVSDPRSRIDAVSQRNRAHGVVRGLGNSRHYRAEISYLHRDDRVREGDMMVTSGMGGVFPSELPIGKVSSVEMAQNGLFQRATVRPAVDVGRLEEVFVVTGRESE